MAEDQVVSQARRKEVHLRAFEEALLASAKSGSIAEIERALRSANGAGIFYEAREGARKRLKKLTDCVGVLREALDSGELALLENALQSAADVGFDEDGTISEAKAKLRELQSSRETLSLVAQEGDIVCLELALKDAVEVGLSDDVLGLAEDKLQELRGCQEFLADVAQAQHVDVTSLEQALQAADKVGLCGLGVVAAQKRLGQMRTCIEDLQTALASGSLEQLQIALRLADDIGVNDMAVTAAKERAEEFKKQELQVAERQTDNPCSTPALASDRVVQAALRAAKRGRRPLQLVERRPVELGDTPSDNPPPGPSRQRAAPPHQPSAEERDAPKAVWKRLRNAAMRNDVGAAKTILDEVEAILGCGAFEKDGHGRSSLHYAAASFSKDVVSLFLERGADPGASNDDGKTPLQELENWRMHAKKGVLGQWNGDPEDTAAVLRSAPSRPHARSQSSSSAPPAPSSTAAIFKRHFEQPVAAGTAACSSEGRAAESSHAGSLQEDAVGSSPVLTGSLQNRILADQLNTCKDFWRLDPSRNREAERRWADRVQEVSVTELRNTHLDVADKFKNGNHQGKPILSLLKELQEGTTRPSDLPYLVAAKQWGKLFVIFGNRRLSMLKRYADSVGHPVSMRVIVHEMPNPRIEPAELQRAFVAKFVLAMATDDGEVTAPIRRRRTNAGIGNAAMWRGTIAAGSPATWRAGGSWSRPMDTWPVGKPY